MAFTPGNPFQSGQAFADQLRTAQELREAQAAQTALQQQQFEARRALSDRFGLGAADPSGLSSIQQSQAQQQFADTSARNAALTEQAQQRQFGLEDSDRARRAVGNAVNAIGQAVGRGATDDQLAQMGQFLGNQLGVAPEDFGFVVESLRAGSTPESIVEAFVGPPPPGSGRGASARTGVVGGVQRVTRLGADGNPESVFAIPVVGEDGVPRLQELTDAEGNPLFDTRTIVGPAGTDTRIQTEGGERVADIPEGSATAARVRRTDQQIAEREQKQAEEIRDRTRTTQTVALTAENLRSRANRVLELLDQVPGAQRETVLSAIARGAFSFAPGSTEFALAQELGSIASSVGLQALTNLDVTLTPVSDRDFQALTESLGLLGVANDPDTLRRTLGDVVRLTDKISEQSNSFLNEQGASTRVGTSEEESIEELVNRFDPQGEN